jgi:glucose-1-phosphate adenylyltransferase
MAGGKGSRMEMLTEVRAKPTLPFGGVYNLIDFPLSNCVHSDLHNVWVIEQFLPYSLNKHLANGKPWDLDRMYGGLQLIPPGQGTNDEGFDRGNADALYRNRQTIRDFNPELLLVLSADHVYKLDYSLVIKQHESRNADVTMVVAQVPVEQAERFGNVHLGEDDKVVEFQYKPDQGQSEWVTAEVFVYNTDKLLATLKQLVDQKKQEQDDEATVKDFGHELIPHLVKEGRAYAYRLPGYWRDVGTIPSYWEGHMDLLQPTPPMNLDEEGWPILTYGVQRMPARIEGSAHIDRSLISPGCVVRGEVTSSVLAPGVIVEEGAVVRHAVVLNNVTIGANAIVDHAILDRRVHVGNNATIGAAPMDGDEPKIALVGQGAQVPNGATVDAGGRVKPSTTVEKVDRSREEPTSIS